MLILVPDIQALFLEIIRGCFKKFAINSSILLKKLIWLINPDHYPSLRKN